MEILLVLTGIVVFIVSISGGILLSNLILKTKENANLKEYINFAKNKINSARYGNFQINIPDKNDKIGLYKSLNSLFESIYDRDLVIMEYREKEKENYNLKEEFIAALTHDLKVPIIAQDKTYDLFMEDKFGKLNEIQKDVISKLKDSNNDLKEMVDSMLETYKMEYTGIKLDIEYDIDVIEFMKEYVEGLKNIAYSNGKKINLYPDTDNLKADFDIFLIKRVLNNLVMNAFIHGKNSDKIDIHINKTADNFSIDIVDFGEGIDEEEIRKIFNKYYSLTNKSTRVSTGLGLYLSNKIIKKHKGTIEVESKKGEGSIFRIILPVKFIKN